MNKKNILSFICLSFICLNLGFSQKTDKVMWKAIDELSANADTSKLVYIDLYTDWCGWCRRMDETTFKDKSVSAYLNNHFNVYKFNGESRRNIIYKEKVFGFDDMYGANKLAVYLTEGNLSYPANIIINVKTNEVYPFWGYKSVKDLEFLLKFFNENKIVNKDIYEVFKTNFKSTW